ncbi:MAG TPA: hypothetical protein VII63_04645 [Caulobacteraceae bacterium]
MTNRTSLFAGAAAGVMLALAVGGVAQANLVHHRRPHAAPAVKDAALEDEVRELKARVDALQSWRDTQAATAAQTQAQLAEVRGQLADSQARAQAAETRVEAQIQTIPSDVRTAVAEAAPKTDKLYIKGVSLTLGGFVAAESVFRSRNEEADIASSFSGIPYTNNALGHTNEFRFSARQSRISGLVEGDATPDIHLAGYAEVDFLGAAQTANSNETNSYTPRMRVFYTTIDLKREFGGLHLLAGQNWSLATLYTNGLTPRAEDPPLTIDAQYVPGFVFARQPQLRLAADFHKQLWLAVSLENPQTTYFNNGQFNPGVSVLTNGPAGSGFNSVNTLSINKVPDVIGKVALQEDLAGHPLHLEGFGVYRDFYARLTSGGAVGNQSVSGGGVGGGAILGIVPKVLDLQISGIWGHGVGRYGAAQLPDATLSVDGSLHPIREWALLAGGIVHAGTRLDVYGYAGEERQEQTAFTNGKILNGVGNLLYNNSGCDTEGGSCVGNSQYIDQFTLGFWHRPYAGPFGKFQWGVQYSYTERHAFPGVGGAPVAQDHMIFTSLRYYPF